MIPRLILSLLPFALALALPAQEVQSPDGTLTVRLSLEGGTLTYQVARSGHLMLEPSPLGLDTSLGSFATGLQAAGTSTARIDERYTLPHGKVREVHYVANELTARFTNADGHRFEVIFRVSDRDVAFAYRLAGRKDEQRIVIWREHTGFNLPTGATTFATWQAKPGDGWMASKPSYEEGYLLDEPVGTKSRTGLGFTFPALFRIGGDGWVLVSETGTTSRYAGTRLGDPTPDGVYPIAFPEPGENGGLGENTVAAPLPLLTPWRTLTVGATLAPIVETTVATDLVQPLYPAADYVPGRVAWSWLVWQDPSMNEADQRAFIDLAATMGWEYILIDALWDANLGRARLAELVAYAASKRVGVLLWYNSNGTWNDAPQGPRNRLDTAPARRQEMAWLKSIGVRGLKVDFFGGDKQVTMKLYEDILTDADAHGLMLVFHGATLPRGWERLYPNFMSSEAVTASENLIFSQGFADGEARLSTVLPVVRNPVAAMDYGPLVLNRSFHKEAGKGNQRRTTDAFQLATTVIYQSPLQHFGLTPNNLTEQPAFVIDFLKQVPAVWDETRYLAGYPGKDIALARRHGARWYIAATNGEKQAKELALHVPFLAGRTLTLIQDASGPAAATRQVTIGADGRLTLSLAVGGGAVLFE